MSRTLSPSTGKPYGLARVAAFPQRLSIRTTTFVTRRHRRRSLGGNHDEPKPRSQYGSNLPAHGE